MTTPNRDSAFRARPPLDRYGKHTYPALVAQKDVARITKKRRAYVHRTPNGFNDPISNYHLVEALLDADPAIRWTSRQLVEWLNVQTPQIIWDPVTVGRMLNTLVEYWIDANGEILCPVERHRYYDGVFYRVAEGPSQHKAILNLLADLERLCDAQVDEEARGELRKRLDSPLLACPSVMRLAAAG